MRHEIVPHEAAGRGATRCIRCGHVWTSRQWRALYHVGSNYDEDTGGCPGIPMDAQPGREPWMRDADYARFLRHRGEAS